MESLERLRFAPSRTLKKLGSMLPVNGAEVSANDKPVNFSWNQGFKQG